MGAGGTSGGVGKFIIGFIMLCVGFYLFFDSVQVQNSFTISGSMYKPFKLFDVTGGMLLIPLIFGIGMIFYNAKNYIGWGLIVGSLSALFFGIISRMSMTFDKMTAFELLVILVLLIGGLGLFLSSLKNSNSKF